MGVQGWGGAITRGTLTHLLKRSPRVLDVGRGRRAAGEHDGAMGLVDKAVLEKHSQLMAAVGHVQRSTALAEVFERRGQLGVVTQRGSDALTAVTLTAVGAVLGRRLCCAAGEAMRGDASRLRPLERSSGS